MNEKTRQLIVDFIKGAVFAASIGICSKLIVMFAFGEMLDSLWTSFIGIIFASISAGYYKIQTPEDN